MSFSDARGTYQGMVTTIIAEQRGNGPQVLIFALHKALPRADNSQPTPASLTLGIDASWCTQAMYPLSSLPVEDEIHGWNRGRGLGSYPGGEVDGIAAYVA